jgi:predicted O-methyltransferase YrrM
MNCIFICVFNNENYLKLLYLLLESIYIYGNLDKYTNILIYTSLYFKNKIVETEFYSNKINFIINNDYNCVENACKSRLDIFEFDIIKTYDKILYLDTDIIIQKDINDIFDLIEEDKIYVMKEGSITEDNDYWGKTLFGDEINNYNDKSAFSSGILLFNNCESIRTLFKNIKDDMIQRKQYFATHDQPYIVYNSFKYNKYNNDKLNNYAIYLNSSNLNIDKTICHFCGGPGNYYHKFIKMTEYLNSLNDNKIIRCINETLYFINDKLIPIINGINEDVEGNIFMLHNSNTFTNRFINKVKNLVLLSINNNINNVMEIGFNSGFSTLLMLISNPNINIDCFDIGEHKYTIPCYNKIKEIFKDRINLTIGDSRESLKNINKTYDLIHIDGGHTDDVATSDINNSYRLAKEGTIIIMDDYDFSNLSKIWDYHINLYNLQKMNKFIYECKFHDIRYVPYKK